MKRFKIVKAIDCRYEVDVCADTEKEALEKANILFDVAKQGVADYCDERDIGRLELFDNDDDPDVGECANYV